MLIIYRDWDNKKIENLTIRIQTRHWFYGPDCYLDYFYRTNIPARKL